MSQAVHPDKNRRQTHLSERQSESGPTDAVGGFSDGASVLQGALRYVSDISDTFINPICICISSSFKSKHAKPWLMREFRIQWNIKEVVHKKTNTDEYHLAKSQLDKLLKNRESQQRTREEISKPSVTLKIVLQVYHFPTMANDN